jgi:hypothetical protein
MRRVWLLLLAGGSTLLTASCAGTGAADPDDPLDRLKLSTSALPAFHWVAEITDGNQTARVEFGWKAPDRAFLRYGPSYAIYFTGGVGHYYTRQGFLRFEAKAELDRLRAAYGDVEIGGEPEPAFTLTAWEQLAVGRGLRVGLAYGRPGARLSWLDELRIWKTDGKVHRRAGLEIELGPEGFLSRARAGERSRLEVKELALGEAVGDALFVPPPREGLGDLSAAVREDLVRTLEEDLTRWAIATDDSDPVIEALVATGLARRYDPKKMAEVLREGLEKSLATWKAENPGAKDAAVREKRELERAKAISSVDVMEKEIEDSFERLLDRVYRGMGTPPPASRMRDTAERWKQAVARQVDLQIRKPFERVAGE